MEVCHTTESWTAPLTTYIYSLESKLDQHIDRNFSITISISIVLSLTIIIMIIIFTNNLNSLKNVQKQLLQELTLLKSKTDTMDSIIHSSKNNIVTLQDDNNIHNNILDSVNNQLLSMKQEISYLHPRIENSLDNNVDGRIHGVLMKLDAIKYEMNNKINHLDSVGVKASNDIQEFSKKIQMIEPNIETKAMTKIENNIESKLIRIFDTKLKSLTDEIDIKMNNNVTILNNDIDNNAINNNAISISNIEKENFNTNIKIESINQDLANMHVVIRSIESTIESTIDKHNAKHNEFDNRINTIISRATNDEAKHVTLTNNLKKELDNVSVTVNNYKDIVDNIVDNRKQVSIIENTITAHDKQLLAIESALIGVRRAIVTIDNDVATIKESKGTTTKETKISPFSSPMQSLLLSSSLSRASSIEQFDDNKGTNDKGNNNI